MTTRARIEANKLRFFSERGGECLLDPVSCLHDFVKPVCHSVRTGTRLLNVKSSSENRCPPPEHPLCGSCSKPNLIGGI